MRPSTKVLSSARQRARGSRDPVQAPIADLRISGGLFDDVRAHVEDFSRGEQAGFLVCSVASRVPDVILCAREWYPIPKEAITRSENFCLSWSAEFNAAMIDRADKLNSALVLVHSHGVVRSPRLSKDDRRNAHGLFPSLSRLLPGRPCGSIVLGDSSAAGFFWMDGNQLGKLGHVSVATAPIEKWRKDSAPRVDPPLLRRLDRQTRALGAASEAKLRAARVAVIGASGGGSHICQQLAHLGVGTLMPIDAELVEDVNLSRMIGTTPSDVDLIPKVDAMERLIHSIDSTIEVDGCQDAFPAAISRDRLKSADLVVVCVDSFLVRDQINTFCRRHLLPLVDIGLGITTEAGRLVVAAGQLVVVTPDSPCLRCTPLLSDALLERERRERPPGYDRNPDAADPQVVSMNGVLASEACNSILDLITGYSGGRRGPAWWAYDGVRGELSVTPLTSRRPGCPGCAELGLGDPLIIADDAESSNCEP